MVDSQKDLETWVSLQCKLNRLFVHDLKNPISALSANLNYLETVPLEESEDIREALSDSVLAAGMLLKLAENFDLIALLESGERFPESQVNLSDFVRSAVGRNKGLSDSAGIHLVIREPLADIGQIWQNRYAELVLDNLIMSAVRHSPHGGQVIVALTEKNGEARVAVLDHGPRIAEEFRAGLFARVSQVEAKRNPGCRYGRGLGLYAVGLAVEALGGRVEINENEGLTEFVCVTPIKAPPDDL
jgi:signal transduction histidine kinase